MYKAQNTHVATSAEDVYLSRALRDQGECKKLVIRPMSIPSDVQYSYGSTLCYSLPQFGPDVPEQKNLSEVGSCHAHVLRVGTPSLLFLNKTTVNIVHQSNENIAR